MKKESQNKKIMAHFKRGLSITTLEAFERYRICRLSERIRELQKSGVRIAKGWEVTPGNCRVMRYSLAE